MEPEPNGGVISRSWDERNPTVIAEGPDAIIGRRGVVSNEDAEVIAFGAEVGVEIRSVTALRVEELGLHKSRQISSPQVGRDRQRIGWVKAESGLPPTQVSAP